MRYPNRRGARPVARHRIISALLCATLGLGCLGRSYPGWSSAKPRRTKSYDLCRSPECQAFTASYKIFRRRLLTFSAVSR